MTNEKEIKNLIARARAFGACVTVCYDGDQGAQDERGFIKSIQVSNLPGIGPRAMAPLYAVERLRESLADICRTLESSLSGQVCALFSTLNVGIERHRFSTTQGEFTVYYDGTRIIRYVDDIRLKDGEFRGLSDMEITAIVERLYKYGCRHNNVAPLHLKQTV